MSDKYNEMLVYLKKKNIQAHINKLANKYKDKNILIYGAGLYFDVIKDNFNLSKLNIVGITDMKFFEETEYRGIKAVPRFSIKNLDFDVIIISNFAFKKIEKSIKSEIFSVCGQYKIDYLNNYSYKELLMIPFQFLHERFQPKIAKESELAHKYLDGLKGIEIGGSSQNPFGLDTINVDFTDEITNFKKEEIKLTGRSIKVDVVSLGDELPFEDNQWDFVVSSHVLEHFWDPIKALREWMRVIKPSGYIFMIIPHKERTFDKLRDRTTLHELIDRHFGALPAQKGNKHHSVWVTEDLLELCDYLNFKVIEYQDVDDKIHNGFTIVVQKD